jgi:pimeloyl-ACP methyl ester carboxylesterase
LKIYGLLTVPDGETPATGWPSIVFIHGYIPPEQYRTTERYIAYVDWLARSDYLVFRIDLRGHDRSEGLASGAYSDPGYLTDVLNAVASLQAYPLADPERIGMWGHSMGGYLTLRAMVISPDVKTGVIWATWWAPIRTCGTLAHGSGPTPTLPLASAGLAWVGCSARPRKIRVLGDLGHFVIDISGPLQCHAVDDAEVPVVFSQELYDDMWPQENGRYYSYKMMTITPDSFSQAATCGSDQYLKTPD